MRVASSFGAGLPYAAVLLASLAACTPPAPASAPTPSARAGQGAAAQWTDEPLLMNPDSIVSSGGVLIANMAATPGTYVLDGVSYTANLYFGWYTPPTLVMNPGDSVSLMLANNLYNGQAAPDTTWTNLHYHGFNVTPLPPGDDVLLNVPNLTGYQYAFRIPSWHRPGLYWYHPHPHGLSEGQVLGGMSGGIIIQGLIENYFPQFTGVTQRVMLLKDHVPPNDPDGAKIKSINGMARSQIAIAPGELQLWRFGNVGADAYYNLKLLDGDGSLVPMLLLARDGNPVVTGGLYVDSLFLPPSSRGEVIVQGLTGGMYLISDVIDTGPQGDPNPLDTLAFATGSGGPAPVAPDTTQSLAQDALSDTIMAVLAAAEGANERTFVFSENAAGDTFYINNVMYDPSVVNTTVAVPSVEVWTIQNTSGEVHVFHIHQGDFLVTEINGVPQPIQGFVDTVNLPYSADGTPTTVKIVIPFQNLGAVGEFVYHCHILEHEDGGMMQNILLYPAGSDPAAYRRAARGHHNH